MALLSGKAPEIAKKGVGSQACLRKDLPDKPDEKPKAKGSGGLFLCDQTQQYRVFCDTDLSIEMLI